MEAIKGIFEKINGILSTYLEPVLQKITQFLSSQNYTVIGIVLFFTALLILVGLFRWLRKAPKLFFFMVFVFGAVVAIWYFLGR